MTDNLSIINENGSFEDFSQEIESALQYADKFINRNYLIALNSYDVIPLSDSLKKFNNIRLYKIERVVFSEDENINDKLVSVYSSLQNLNSSAVLIIDGKCDHIDFYIGTYSMENASTAGLILEKGFKGNFPGSLVRGLKKSEIEDVLTKITDTGFSFDRSLTKKIASVSIVPSYRDKDKENFVQGIEKFIDTMTGTEYSAIILASPLNKSVLEERKRGLEELYSAISPYAETSFSYGINYSQAISKSSFASFSNSVNRSVSNSNTSTSSENSSTTVGNSSGNGFGIGGFSTNSGKSTSSTKGYSSSNSWAKSITEGVTETNSSGSTDSDTTTTGDNRNFTINHENKSVKGLMEQIEEHLDRIKECESFGLWECAAYFISPDIQTTVVAANTYKALMSGDKSSVENSFVNIWDSSKYDNTKKLLEYVSHCLQPQFIIPSYGSFDNQVVSPACLVSGNEIPLLMGLPKRSVPGLSSLSMASFGRNVYSETLAQSDKKLKLGNVYHMGMDEETKVYIDVNSLSSHCFITGSTGSGKSNTSYHILTQLASRGIKFLVVEPAKGEYKSFLGGIEDINIFCTNPNYCRMLKLNPFSFNDEVHVLEHIERLIDIFNACWPLYAAMPAILKDAVEQSYELCGWDLETSNYFKNENHKFPTFYDILKILPDIINSSSYSSDSKGDYIGSLVTRVKSLTNGINGQIFCDSYSISDEVLFDQNTIIDISRIGSAETKSLVMGFLVLKINEHRMSNAKGKNAELQHVTILEEAHNILKRTSTEQGQESANLAGKSVEMICNSIAEMRTFGEGFILIDQSPTTVDISAIKNTNTKIIMKLPEMEDCEAVGSALSLNEEQIKEISKLGRGKAIVTQNDWLEAVLTSVDKCTNEYNIDVLPIDKAELNGVKGKIVKALYKQYISQSYDCDAICDIIFSSTIDKQKLNELRDCINFHFKEAQFIEKYEFGRFLIEFIGCKGLFKAIQDNLRMVKMDVNGQFKKTDVQNAKLWFKDFETALDRYITIDKTLKKKILKYSIYSMIKDFKNDDRYILIYEANLKR